jgi:hypothetical protein
VALGIPPGARSRRAGNRGSEGQSAEDQASETCCRPRKRASSLQSPAQLRTVETPHAGKKRFRTKLFDLGRYISSKDAAAMQKDNFTPAT